MDAIAGTARAALQLADGDAVTAEKTVGAALRQWQELEMPYEVAKARLILTVDRPGTIWFSLVSLLPPTYRNQTNGFRPDLLQMLIDMRPKFLRFPGGNYLEGDQIADRFEWKKTLGPVSERPGHMAPWGYRSTGPPCWKPPPSTALSCRSAGRWIRARCAS